MQERSRRDIETLIAGGAFLEWWDDVGLARDREASIAARIASLEEEVAMHAQVGAGLEHDAETLMLEVGELDSEAAKREVERGAAAAKGDEAQAANDTARKRVDDAMAARAKAAGGAERRAATEAFRAASDAKDSAWTATEAAHDQTTRLAIQIGELRVLARRKKAMAEKALADSRLVRAGARERRAEAEHATRALGVARHATRKLLHEAAHRFGALVVSEYLYWRDPSDAGQLVCVPAVAQTGNPVVHVVDADSGIQSIEHILSAPRVDVEPSRAIANS